jgi:hypothetical protein
LKKKAFFLTSTKHTPEASQSRYHAIPLILLGPIDLLKAIGFSTAVQQ